MSKNKVVDGKAASAMQNAAQKSNQSKASQTGYMETPQTNTKNLKK